MNINQNIAACIEHTNNFGSTVVHNICNGATQVVPWGGMDWAATIGLMGVGVVICALFGVMAIRLILDI